MLKKLILTTICIFGVNAYAATCKHADGTKGKAGFPNASECKAFREACAKGWGKDNFPHARCDGNVLYGQQLNKIINQLNQPKKLGGCWSGYRVKAIKRLTKIRDAKKNNMTNYDSSLYKMVNQCQNQGFEKN